MRFGIYIGILFLFLSLYPSQQEERMEWSANRLLRWSDFKGVPNQLGDYAATTSSGLSQSYSISSTGYINKESITIKANFYPQYSWYRAKDTTAYVLKHEQTHFDITELHARYLRKRIADFSFTSNAAAEIKALYQEVETQRRAMQKQFDEETQHSIIREKEYYWEAKVAVLLAQTAQ